MVVDLTHDRHIGLRPCQWDRLNAAAPNVTRMKSVQFQWNYKI